MANRVAAADGVRVLNDVVLNQVLLRFGEDDVATRAVVRRFQQDGVGWASGSTWHGMAVMRISVFNWSTTEADADRSADAILAAWNAVSSQQLPATASPST
jgi:hypothetical protein